MGNGGNHKYLYYELYLKSYIMNLYLIFLIFAHFRKYYNSWILRLLKLL